MSKINPYFLATGLIFLICGYAYAGGSIEFLGNFSGGTVGAPTVFTGDNASGTGTVRIRPSDEDTQLVLCEASNNAATEMCTSGHHLNSSATQSYGGFGTNMYFDSSSTPQRYWTSAGFGRVWTAASSTASGNEAGLQVYGTGGAEAGRVSLQASAAATSTLFVGVGGTVTSDFRGPITNGGSATCDGLQAGTTCVIDNAGMMVNGSSAAVGVYAQNTDATGYSHFTLYSSADVLAGQLGYGNASMPDADYASSVFLYAGTGAEIVNIRGDDVAAGTVMARWKDNANASGVTLMTLTGGGTVAPLLYGSQSNCSDGAGAAACSAAPAGSVVIDAAATTVVVSTTAVTANSQIFIQEDSSLGTKLSVTCNTTTGRDYTVSARTAATSFTITSSAAPVTNPACLSYFIVN